MLEFAGLQPPQESRRESRLSGVYLHKHDILRFSSLFQTPSRVDLVAVFSLSLSLTTQLNLYLLKWTCCCALNFCLCVLQRHQTSQIESKTSKKYKNEKLF